MKTFRLLLSPEGDGGAPAADQKPAPAPDTSADIVSGKSAALFKKLETRISVLEDQNRTLSEKNSAFEKDFAKLREMPGRSEGKSLWDEISDFLFSNPTNPNAK